MTVFGIEVVFVLLGEVRLVYIFGSWLTEVRLVNLPLQRISSPRCFIFLRTKKYEWKDFMSVVAMLFFLLVKRGWFKLLEWINATG